MSAALLLEDGLQTVNREANEGDSPAGATSVAAVHNPIATPSPRSLFNKLLENAAYLLSYAVEAGITVDAELAQRIIAAGRHGEAAWTDATAGTLASDITKLAALVHPVTADTLWASESKRVIQFAATSGSPSRLPPSSFPCR